MDFFFNFGGKGIECKIEKFLEMSLKYIQSQKISHKKIMEIFSK